MSSSALDELPLEVLTKEITPRLDTPSLLSLSFATSKFHSVLSNDSRLVYNKMIPLKDYDGPEDIIGPLLLETLKAKHFDLFLFFSSSFRKPLRSSTTHTYLMIVREILSHGKMEVLDELERITGKRIVVSDETEGHYLSALASAGSIETLRSFIAKHFIDLSRMDNINKIFVGGASGGHIPMLEFAEEMLSSYSPSGRKDPSYIHHALQSAAASGIDDPFYFFY